MLPGLTLTSNTAQRVLSQASNIGYLFRDGWRIETVIGDDRKTDYLVRHFIPTIFFPYLYEISFRFVDTQHTLPQMARALQLDKLTELYPNAPGVHNIPNLAAAEAAPLRSRIVGSLVKADNHYLVPSVFEERDAHKMAPELRSVLVPHLKRMMHYDGYIDDVLVAGKQLTQAQGTALKNALKYHQIATTVAGDLLKAGEKANQAVQQAIESLRVETLTDDEALKALNQLLKTAGSKIQLPVTQTEGAKGGLELTLKALSAAPEGKLTETIGQMVEQKVKQAGTHLVDYLKEGLQSKTTLATLKKIQVTGFYPKMLVSVILNFLAYGVATSYIDVNIAQPWQERMLKEGYNPGKITRLPSYLSIIPALGVFMATMSEKWASKIGINSAMSKLGYLGRFTVGGGLALCAYFASLMGMIAYNKANAPRHTFPQPKVAIPQGFREVPLNRQNAFQVFQTRM